MRHGITDTSTGAGDNGRLAGEGEALQDGTAIDPALVVVDEVAAVEGVEVRHDDGFMVVWESIRETGTGEKKERRKREEEKEDDVGRERVRGEGRS